MPTAQPADPPVLDSTTILQYHSLSDPHPRWRDSLAVSPVPFGAARLARNDRDAAACSEIDSLLYIPAIAQILSLCRHYVKCFGTYDPGERAHEIIAPSVLIIA